MNLEHLWDDRGSGLKPRRPIGDSELIALLAVSNDLRQIAETVSASLARRHRTTAWALWVGDVDDAS